MHCQSLAGLRFQSQEVCSPHPPKERALTAVDSVVITVRVWASQVVLVVKNPPASAGDIRDAGSIPGLGRSLGRGCGNPLQYSCWRVP